MYGDISLLRCYICVRFPRGSRTQVHNIVNEVDSMPKALEVSKVLKSYSSGHVRVFPFFPPDGRQGLGDPPQPACSITFIRDGELSPEVFLHRDPVPGMDMEALTAQNEVDVPQISVILRGSLIREKAILQTVGDLVLPHQQTAELGDSFGGGYIELAVYPSLLDYVYMHSTPTEDDFRVWAAALFAQIEPLRAHPTLKEEELVDALKRAFEAAAMIRATT